MLPQDLPDFEVLPPPPPVPPSLEPTPAVPPPEVPADPEEPKEELVAFLSKKRPRFPSEHAPSGCLARKKRPSTKSLALDYCCKTEDGPEGTTLLYVQGKVKEHRVTVLIDSGASDNFVDLRLARLSGLSISSEKRQVKLANGSKVSSPGRANCPLRVKGRNYELECKVMPIAGCDVILGMKWLKSFNPDIDWATGTISLTVGTSERVWRATRSTPRVPDPAPEANFITAREAERCLKRNQCCGLIFVAAIPEPAPPQPPEDPLKDVVTGDREETLKLVEEFPEITQDLPPGEPPERGLPFRIHLEPGHTPPHAATRKMSSLELEELRKQLQEYV